MSTGENEHRVFRFGEFSLDLDREALYRGKRALHLRPKAFRVLVILLENASRLVSKSELHEAVWKHTVVTDDSLAHCIADIRRTLGDSGFEMIRTVPRRGYVFDHAVTRDIDAAYEPRLRRDRFAYQTGAVAAGLLAAILLLLGIGHRGATGDVGEDADEILAATTVRVDRPSAGINAHSDYEKGRFFFQRRGDGDIERAEASFKAALEQAPELADAWIGLAGVYRIRLNNGDLSRETGIPLLGDATRHAIRLAPDSAEAHVRRATYYHYAGEQLLALEHMATAMALDPDDVLVLGHVAGDRARRSLFDEAIELQRRAIRGDPTSALLHHNLVWFLLAAGRFPEAGVAAEQYRALYPPGVGDEGELFVDVQILQGNYEQALIRARAMAGGPAQDRNLAIIHRALGQGAEADAALQRLLTDGGEAAAIYTAEVFAHRGNIDEAMRWLSGALDSPERDEPGREQRCEDAWWLLSPYLIPLRSDERWNALYAEVLEVRDYPELLARAHDAQAMRKE